MALTPTHVLDSIARIFRFIQSNTHRPVKTFTELYLAVTAAASVVAVDGRWWKRAAGMTNERQYVVEQSKLDFGGGK